MSRYEEIAARAEQTSQYRESSHTAPWEVELDRLFLLARVRELEQAAENALARLQSPSYPDAARPLLDALGRGDEFSEVWQGIFDHMQKLRRGEA